MVVVVLWVLLASLLCTVDAVVDVVDFFPDLNGDMTQVTWAHAVNSIALLEAALAATGEDAVMMLEADVVLGTLIGGEGKLEPVMAHPPTNASDLTLRAFLDRVISDGTKGIKLDFKTTDALQDSLAILRNSTEQLAFPVWLNADVLRGPALGTGTPVDADVFLGESAAAFPTSTLSAGWTTSWGPLFVAGGYTEEQVDEMSRRLADNGVVQPVTFPVRAGPAAHSAVTLPRLLADVANSTLTIWGSATDAVDHERLARIVLDVGRNKVFIDLPAEVRAELDRWLDQLGGANSTEPTA